MTLVDPALKEKLSPQVRTQAAAWLARLHGPNRSARVEEGFRRWLAADPNHALAFEVVTDVWEGAGRIRRPFVSSPPSEERIRVRGFLAAVAIATAVLLAVAATFPYLRNDAVITRIGEQRILTLEDGSRMFLNTATRARIVFDARTRRIELEAGEALFEVAKQPQRPFIVIAGDKEILALGTSFLVRRDEQKVAVTLMEGKVQVGQSRILLPGQRLTYAQGEQPRMDQPPLEKVTAWRQGQVVVDDVPLSDAATEMNRYSKQRLIIEQPEAQKIRISGAFRAGDSMNFAMAVAKTYRLRVVESGKEIVLSGLPSAPLE